MSNDPNGLGRWAQDPAGSGRLRYFDGNGWTDHYRDPFPQPGRPAGATAVGAPTKKGRGCLTAGLIAIGVLAVLVVIGAVASGGDKDKAETTGTTAPTTAPTTEAPVTTAAPSDAPATTAPPTTAPPVTDPPPVTYESKGFTLESLDVKNQFDNFSGVGRIVDTENSGRTATFKVTLFAGDQIVGTMSGVATDMPGGQAVTVDFYSSDPFADFDRYEFQTDAAF
jgi:hypothetical protein